MKSLILAGWIALWALQNANAATTFGVNAHLLTNSPAYSNLDLNQLMARLKAYGLKHIRVDVALADDTVPAIYTKFQTLLTAANAQGIELKPTLHVPFTWGDRTDNGRYPLGNEAALFSQGFNRTYDMVRQFGAQVRDWELGNELNLLVHDANGSPLFGKGMTAAEFNTPLMNDWSYVLHGMTEAIETVNMEQSLNMRRILGTTSSMFGFIDFMKSQYVIVDVLGYHYYEHAGVDPYHYWLASGGTFDLFAKMASYNMPVIVNEMNCAEIYDANFVNTGTSTTMQTCNSNLATTMHVFATQTAAPIEAIQAYEFLDEPDKTGAESRFGLMFDFQTPKPMLASITAEAQTNLVCSGATVTVTAPMSLAPDACFSGRSSSAVFTDTNGVMKTAAANGLRVDFDPLSHAFNGIVLEPAATNLVPNSTNISSTAYWNRNGTPVFNQATATPDGSLAYSVSSSAAFSGVYKSVPVSPNTAYTYSVYLKYVSGSASVRVGLGAGFVDFNTSSGAVTASSGLTGSPVVKAVGSGWYRVTLTVTSGTTATSMAAIAYSRTSSASENSFWGLQVELGSSASSYVATSTGAATRAADAYRLP